MRSTSWIALFRLLPPEFVSKMALVTKSGSDLTVQAIYRLETEFVLLRGRMSGTTDEGTPIFLPYDQIDYIAMREMVNEETLNKLFDNAPQVAEDNEESVTLVPGPLPAYPAVRVPPPIPGRPVAPQMPVPPKLSPRVPTPVIPAAEPSPTIGTAPNILPGKAALLERLRRARSGQDPAAPPNG